MSRVRCPIAPSIALPLNAVVGTLLIEPKPIAAIAENIMSSMKYSIKSGVSEVIIMIV